MGQLLPEAHAAYEFRFAGGALAQSARQSACSAALMQSKVCPRSQPLWQSVISKSFFAEDPSGRGEASSPE